MATAQLHPAQLNLPHVVHQTVRREIARMNTAICQATQHSPIKVSLTWRPNPQFAELLSDQVLGCLSQQLLSAQVPDCTNGESLMSAPSAPRPDPTYLDRSVAQLEKHVTETIERLERVLIAFKAASAQV
jgi:hypothetical protein